MPTDLYEQAESLQNLLVAHATGGYQDEAEYRELRQVFVSDRRLEPLLPRFVRTCRNLAQFWEFIKYKFGRYHERRTFIWGEFEELLFALEAAEQPPSDEPVSTTLEEFDSAHIHAVWSKALDRREGDPEGAITMARTLLESVCKFILDDLEVEYDDSADLPKLYRGASETLNLAPSQHTRKVFKQILGGCAAVVEGLGSLRNRLSDSHGKGKRFVKPAARHTELAVNLSGAMCQYLVATWEIRKETTT